MNGDGGGSSGVDIATTNTKDDDYENHSEKFLNKAIFLPADESGQIVEEIGALEIEEIVDRVLNIEASKIVENHKKRSIPRFRY